MVKLNRIKTFLLGVFIIAVFYILNRVNQIVGTEQINGMLKCYVIVDTIIDKEQEIYPLITYSFQGKEFEFYGREGSAFQKFLPIPLLIKKNDISNPIIYTIGSFWLFPLFYTLLPLLLWSAFSLSYVDKNEEVSINFRYPFFEKKKPDYPNSKKLNSQ